MYSANVQNLTNSKEGSKLYSILMDTGEELHVLVKENSPAVNSIPVPIPVDQVSIAAEFMARVAAGR